MVFVSNVKYFDVEGVLFVGFYGVKCFFGFFLCLFLVIVGGFLWECFCVGQMLVSCRWCICFGVMFNVKYKFILLQFMFLIFILFFLNFLYIFLMVNFMFRLGYRVFMLVELMIMFVSVCLFVCEIFVSIFFVFIYMFLLFFYMGFRIILSRCDNWWLYVMFFLYIGFVIGFCCGFRQFLWFFCNL